MCIKTDYYRKKMLKKGKKQRLDTLSESWYLFLGTQDTTVLNRATKAQGAAMTIRLFPGVLPGKMLVPLGNQRPTVGSPTFHEMREIDLAKIVLDRPNFLKGRNWMKTQDVWDWARGKKAYIPLGIRERTAFTSTRGIAELLEPKLRGEVDSMGVEIIFLDCPGKTGQWARTVATMVHRPTTFDDIATDFFLDGGTEYMQSVTDDKYIAFYKP